jgi:hypothetical protein
MSEEEDQRQEEIPETGWTIFNGKPVLLQLREPYVGLEMGTYDPATTPDRSGLRAVGFVKGLLTVERGTRPGEVMLVIRMPIPEPGDVAVIAVDPDNVVHCTHLEMKSIITA